MSEAMDRPQDERYPETEAQRETTPDHGRKSPGFEGGAWQNSQGAENSGAPAAGYCRVCGRSLGAAEIRQAQGVIYCPEHVPAMPGYGPGAYAQPGYGPASMGGQPGYGRPMEPPSPYSSTLPPSTAASPGLAFLLGLIPGVGAVYNAQYVKAIVHVVVFGLLISILSAGAADGFEPLFGLLIAIWYLYMPFEAYHTARKRAMGIPVDDVSSLFPMRSATSGFPIGPVVLIALGVIFMLAQFDLISFSAILRYWPAALILAGGWMLYERMAVKSEPS